MEDIRFPWKRILEQVGMTAETVDKKKLWRFLDKNLEDWIKSRPRLQILDPALVELLPKKLHALLRANNMMRLDHAALLLATDKGKAYREEEVRRFTEQIRLYVRDYPDCFRISGRAHQTIYRIADARKKPTGVRVDEPAGRRGAVDEPRTRYSGTIRELGLDVQEFNRAKMANGGQVTLRQLKDWMAKRGAQTS